MTTKILINKRNFIYRNNSTNQWLPRWLLFESALTLSAAWHDMFYLIPGEQTQPHSWWPITAQILEKPTRLWAFLRLHAHLLHSGSFGSYSVSQKVSWFCVVFCHLGSPALQFLLSHPDPPYNVDAFPLPICQHWLIDWLFDWLIDWLGGEGINGMGWVGG